MMRQSRQLLGPAGQRLCPCGSRYPLMQCPLCPKSAEYVGRPKVADAACEIVREFRAPNVVVSEQPATPPAEQLPPGWVRDIDVDYPAYDHVGGARVVIQADGKFWRWRAPEQSIDESQKYKTCNLAMCAALGIKVLSVNGNPHDWMAHKDGPVLAHDQPTAYAAALAALHAHAGQKPVEQPRKPGEFRVGDKVRCMLGGGAAEGHLLVGETYTVASKADSYGMMNLRGVDSPFAGWDIGRFELVTPAPEQP